MDLIGGDTTLVVVIIVLLVGEWFYTINGGVNTLVSPRLSNNGDVLSFFTKVVIMAILVLMPVLS